MYKTVSDPVCGMVIEPINAAAQTTYQDKTYYFCSQECKSRFDKNPKQYVEKSAQPVRSS